MVRFRAPSWWMVMVLFIGNNARSLPLRVSVSACTCDTQYLMATIVFFSSNVVNVSSFFLPFTISLSLSLSLSFFLSFSLDFSLSFTQDSSVQSFKFRKLCSAPWRLSHPASYSFWPDYKFLIMFNPRKTKWSPWLHEEPNSFCLGMQRLWRIWEEREGAKGQRQRESQREKQRQRQR